MPDESSLRHCMQVFLRENREFAAGRGWMCAAAKLERRLDEDMPRLEYKAKSVRGKRLITQTVLHLGQRKLLMSEFEFLTHSLRDDESERRVLIYAGAAPGVHFPVVHALFADKFEQFVLVDPRPFDLRLRTLSNTMCRVEYMTDKLAAELRAEYDGCSVWFISDIRTDNDVLPGNSEVKVDMSNQLLWKCALNAKHSLFKFRLPWPTRGSEGGSYKYAGGVIFLPIWGPHNTTETRLWVRDTSIKNYDILKYEEQMCYFNEITRVQMYGRQHAHTGHCVCFDCQSELRVLRDCIQLVDKHWDLNRVLCLVNKWTNTDLLREPVPQRGMSRFEMGHRRYRKRKRIVDPPAQRVRNCLQ
jgi:hypothetical protein